MGGVSRGMRGTGGRSILVRIPWMPHMGRETQIAARGGLKTAICGNSAGYRTLAAPHGLPIGPAARRAVIPPRARVEGIASWVGRRNSARRPSARARRASAGRRAETLDTAPVDPRACAGRRRARVPHRGCGPPPRTARSPRRGPERRPGAGRRQPRARLRGPEARRQSGAGSGPTRAALASMGRPTRPGPSKSICEAATSRWGGALVSLSYPSAGPRAHEI